MELSATKRTLTGRKVKKLRKQGKIPATVYGKKTPSQSLEIEKLAFSKIHRQAGDTKLIDLKLEGGKTLPVLIHQIQFHPVSHFILHVDFLAVDLKEAVKVHVPLVAVGVSQAVKDKLGALLNPIQDVEIECLPADLPKNIQIDISPLAALGDAIKVADIKLPNKIKILTDGEQIVFKIGELVQKEKIEEKVTPTEVEATAEKKPEETAAEGAGETKEAGKETGKEVKKEEKKEKKEEKK